MDNNRAEITAIETTLARRRMSAKVIAGKAFMIKTPVVHQFSKFVVRGLLEGSQGALVYGRPRRGKTMGMRWVLKELRKLIGCQVPHVWIPTRGVKVASEREFFQHILRWAKCHHYREGSSGDKRDRLAELLASRALRSPISTIIMVFDEAQLLTNSHFQWILNIGNELEARGGLLYCLFLGQQELEGTKDRLIDQGMEQFVGRYMVDTFEYTGITSEEDLRLCLEQFDKTPSPENHDRRWHQLYMPDLLPAEMPLSGCASAAWAKFSAMSKGLDDCEIPMSNLCRFVTNLLADCASKDVRPDPLLVAKAIDRCGYTEAVAIRKRVLDNASTNEPANAEAGA